MLGKISEEATFVRKLIAETLPDNDTHLVHNVSEAVEATKQGAFH